MRRARGDAAVEQAAQRQHLRTAIPAEAEVVDEQQEGAVLPGQFSDQCREGGERSGRELDQSQMVRFPLHIGHAGPHQRRFAHAPRAPQQRIMRRRAAGQTAAQVAQANFLRLDPLERIQR